MYNNILTQIENGILTVTINRAAALNALNVGVFTDIDHVFSELIPNTAGLTGVIITGSGEKAFAAGADIKEFLALDAAGAQAMAARGQGIFFKIERCRLPVIAAVNGFALGGGCELAMACHIRIAGEKAKFGQPEVNLGLTPGYGGTQRLVQLIGKGKALELLLTADIIGAADALALGLVNHVVPVGEEVAFATTMLQKMATKAPIALAETIAAVNAHFDETQDGFAAEVHAFGRCAATADYVEGATAFIEKRKAVFVGA